MGRVARNTDPRRLKFLKSRIDNDRYQRFAVQQIAEMLTHILLDDKPDTAERGTGRRSSYNNSDLHS